MPNVPDQDINDLVARAQQGDGASVARLFDLLGNRIFRYVSLRTPDTETAEDLTQTVFVEMIQALPRYRLRTNAKFTTWLFQIARFRLIDYYRKQRASVSIDQVPEPSDDPLADRDPIAVKLVETALKTLSEKYQTVLHLRFREDLDTNEIASIMNTTPLNVRVIQFRALRALRAALEPE